MLRPPLHCHPRSGRAFTLYETLLVLALVMVLVTVFSVPVLGWLRDQQKSAGLREVKSAVRLARVRALQERTRARFVLAPDTEAIPEAYRGRAYLVMLWDADEEAFVRLTGWNQLPVDTVFNLDHPEAPAGTQSQIWPSFGTDAAAPAAEFLPDGTPDPASLPADNATRLVLQILEDGPDGREAAGEVIIDSLSGRTALTRP